MSDPQQPAPGNPTPPTGPAPEPAATQPAPDPAAVAAHPAPDPAPAATQPAPGVPHAAHPQGRAAAVGRVARHRATQLVAVGLLGLVLGGGIVALADRDDHRRYGGGFDRPGHSRFDDRGPGRDFPR